MKEFKILKAKKSEIPKVLALVKLIFSNVEVRQGENDLIFIAENTRREIIGFAHFSQNGKDAVLEGIGVKPEFRDLGVGSALIEKGLEVVSKKSQRITLKVKSLNRAVNFYAKHGFFLEKFDFDNDTYVLVKIREN